MKFDKAKYWRHDYARDVFFCVNKVVFDDDGRTAILRGTWATQTPVSWFFTVHDRIIIRPEQYERWRPYEPKGKIRL